MKICHVVPSLQEQHGGPSKSVRALCRALARAGHTVQLLTTAPEAPRDGTEERDDDRLLIRRFRRSWPQRLCFAPGLRKALQQSDADVVHHHGLWLRTLHYAHHATRNGTPLVVSPRGMMSAWAWQHHRKRKRFSRALVHPAALEHVAGWHATSAEEISDIRRLGFGQSACVAPNGVEAPSDQAVADATAHWRRLCPEVAVRPTALFYGRFHQKKRVIELIDAWVEHAPAEWLLLLVGLPEDYTPAMLDQYALKLSASGRIRAYAGAGHPAPYAVASLFLLPSHSENFGLTIAEAMAHGVPALVTDTTPWRAVNAGWGWCVPWAEYGPALGAATHEPAAALAARGARARAWVLREYAWDQTAGQLAAFYGSLMARPS